MNHHGHGVNVTIKQHLDLKFVCKANEREYVLNILGENDYPKLFLNDCLR